MVYFHIYILCSHQHVHVYVCLIIHPCISSCLRVDKVWVVFVYVLPSVMDAIKNIGKKKKKDATSTASSCGPLTEAVFRAWWFLTRSSPRARSDLTWGLGRWGLFPLGRSPHQDHLVGCHDQGTVAACRATGQPSLSLPVRGGWSCSHSSMSQPTGVAGCKPCP